MDGCAVEADGLENDFCDDEIDDGDESNYCPNEKNGLEMFFVDVVGKKKSDDEPDCT